MIFYSHTILEKDTEGKVIGKTAVFTVDGITVTQKLSAGEKDLNTDALKLVIEGYAQAELDKKMIEPTLEIVPDYNLRYKLSPPEPLSARMFQTSTKHEAPYTATFEIVEVSGGREDDPITYLWSTGETDEKIEVKYETAGVFTVNCMITRGSMSVVKTSEPITIE